ncbi:MAG TPA: hypothetical protein VK714_16480 [Myxococcota bacterium]|nr:hypothetical protein [Myxococcota bacterium]
MADLRIANLDLALLYLRNAGQSIGTAMLGDVLTKTLVEGTAVRFTHYLTREV